MKKTANDSKIEREKGELSTLLLALPLNPIPWATVVTVLAPIVARLAVRWALKKTDRSLSEDKVNAIGNQAGAFIGGIIAKRLSQESPSDG